MLDATPGEISGLGRNRSRPERLTRWPFASWVGRVPGWAGCRYRTPVESPRESVEEGDLPFAVALLHDVIENGRTTAEDLLAATGDARLVELVVSLTRDELESEDEYPSALRG